jgi:DNA-binding transcriptional LysR family regulator
MTDRGSDDLDWRLVRAFIAVMQEGTLSKASRRLGLAQPTVGRQIRDLERRSGEVLFLRRGTALEPTEAARGLLARAEDVDASVRSLGTAFLRLSDRAGPRLVRITLPTLIADHLLPRLLPGILAAVPQLRIQVEPSDAVQDLYRRRADIALRLTDPRQPDLIVQRIGQVSFGMFGARPYLAQNGVPATLHDLLAHRLILPADDRIVATVAARAGISPADLDAPLRSHDLRHRHALLTAGLGLGVGHHWMDGPDGLLQRVLPDFDVDTRTAWLVATEDLRASKTQRALFDALRDAFSAVLAREGMT